jgi:transposase InsO family protein
MVVVDQFTKYSHFISSSHPYTIINVTHSFLKNIYKYHGIPTLIITDRDPIFTRNFGEKILKLLGIKLNMSSTYNPKTNSQIEKVNQFFKNYLHSMLLDQPKK